MENINKTNQTTCRKLKIIEVGDFYKHKTVPTILLKGKWLQNAGFPSNQHVNIEFLEPGKMIITAID